MKSERFGGVAALTLILLLSGGVGMAENEEPVDAATGVEQYIVDCTPGDPTTIEVAPSTGRIELLFLGGSAICYCFDSAEAASSWLVARGEMVMAGEMDPEIDFGGQDTKVAEPGLGEKVEVVMYCLTDSQVFGYLEQLLPADG